jgi:O-antigen/teichoic acid export membrane protein
LLFSKRIRNNRLSSHVSLINKIVKSKLIKISFLSLVGLFASLIITNIDYLFISTYLDIRSLSIFQVFIKIQGILISITFLLNSSITPVLVKSYSHKAFSPCSIIYVNYSKWLTTFSSLIAFVLLILIDNVINIWVGNSLYVGDLFVFLSGIYFFFFSSINLNYILINSLNFISKSLPVLLLEIILKVFLMVVFIQFIGINSIALSQVFSTLLSSFIFFPRVLKESSNGVFNYSNKKIINYFIYFFFPLYFLIFLIKISNTFYLIKYLFYLILLLFFILITYFQNRNEINNFISSLFKARKNLID